MPLRVIIKWDERKMGGTLWQPESLYYIPVGEETGRGRSEWLRKTKNN